MNRVMGGMGTTVIEQQYKNKILSNLTWGGEHTIQCMDNLLWNCTPETCIILLISVIPTHSIFKKGK